MPDPEQSDPLDGPWLAAAVFCEAVLEDPDGGRSLIRLHQGGEFNADRAETAYGEPVLFLSFIGGSRVGPFRLEIVAHRPQHLAEQVAGQDFKLDGPGSGHDIFAPIRISADAEGIAWFDVRLDSRLITRMAYRVLQVARPLKMTDALG